MDKQRTIPVDELADFMNVGWPGEDWYLDDHHESLWDSTFTTGENGALYRPAQPGALVNLSDFEARVRWQGLGSDPTCGRGFKLTELFLRWQRKRRDAVVVAYVPQEKFAEVAVLLKRAGCLVIHGNKSASTASAELVAVL